MVFSYDMHGLIRRLVAFGGSAALAAGCIDVVHLTLDAGPPEPAQFPTTIYPINFRPIEPDPLTRVAYVDWFVTTSSAEYSGRTYTPYSDPFSIPRPWADEVPTKLELRGYGANNVLRASGTSTGGALSISSGSILLLLYEEFVTFPDLAAPPLTGHLVYVDPLHRVVVVGGDERIQIREVVEAFDPHTLTLQPVGELLHPRHAFGSMRLSDGRFLLAGGVGDPNTSQTAELWDPTTNTASDAGAMNYSRHQEPNIVRTGVDSWAVIGGLAESAGGQPADVFIEGSVGFGTTDVVFDRRVGGVDFSRPFATPNGYEYHRWFGYIYTSPQSGRVYRDGTTGPTATFDYTKYLWFPTVLDAGDDGYVVWGSRLPDYTCDAVYVMSGLSTVDPFTLSSPICDPALMAVAPGVVRVVGGWIRRGHERKSRSSRHPLASSLRNRRQTDHHSTFYIRAREQGWWDSLTVRSLLLAGTRPPVQIPRHCFPDTRSGIPVRTEELNERICSPRSTRQRTARE